MSVAISLILDEENKRLRRALDRIRRAVGLNELATPDDIADECESREASACLDRAAKIRGDL